MTKTDYLIFGLDLILAGTILFRAITQLLSEFRDVQQEEIVPSDTTKTEDGEVEARPFVETLSLLPESFCVNVLGQLLVSSVSGFLFWVFILWALEPALEGAGYATTAYAGLIYTGIVGLVYTPAYQGWRTPTFVKGSLIIVCIIAALMHILALGVLAFYW